MRQSLAGLPDLYRHQLASLPVVVSETIGDTLAYNVVRPASRNQAMSAEES
jgi:hypothetical protein